MSRSRLVTRLGSLGAVLAASAAAVVVGAGTANADTAPGCSVSTPDTHLVAGRKVDTQFLFRCDNPRIRYVKVTLNIRRDRSGWSDPAVSTYQFDDFTNPSKAGVNAPLVTDGACEKGKSYHGDITVNVTMNADQTFTETKRGPSVDCK